MGQYYYLDGADPIGPFDLQDVYTLIDREVVGPETMMCREGGAEWQLLPLLPELNGKSKANASTRGSSTGPRRRRKDRVNLTAVIIALLFSVVAIYVTYTIGHQTDDATQDADHVTGR